MAGGKEGKNKEVLARTAKAVVEKSRGLWGISQCWRGVVQQQVELGGPTGKGGTFPGWLEQGVGSGSALGAWGGHRAVPGLHRAWSSAGTALLCLPPWRGSGVSQALCPG